MSKKIKIIDLSKEDPESLKDKNGNIDFNKIQQLMELANPEVESETTFGLTKEEILDPVLNPDCRMDIPFLKELKEKINKRKRQEML